MAYYSSDIPILPLLLTAIASGIVSTGSLLAYSVFAPRCQFWAPVIRSLPQSNGVALTFDDGPHPRFTPAILDILRDHSVKATFFVIGRWAREFPELIRRIHDEGHALGNHTLDHAHLGINRNRAYWDTQIGETQRIILNIVGQKPLLFRPPMGFKTWHIAGAARRESLPVIGWSVRGYDTRRNTSAGGLAKHVLRQTTGHDIIMLHDGIDPDRARREKDASQQATVDALPAIIAGIREKELIITPLIDALVLGAKDHAEAARRTREKAAT